MNEIQKIATWLLLMLTAVFFAACMVSCKTKEYVYVTQTDSVYVHRVDTVKKVLQQVDSVYVHDSVFVSMSDSVKLVEKWHTMYKIKEVHDTLWQTRIDTVSVKGDAQYIEKKEVVKQMSVKQMLWSAGVGAVLGALLMVYVRRRFFS